MKNILDLMKDTGNAINKAQRASASVNRTINSAQRTAKNLGIGSNKQNVNGRKAQGNGWKCKCGVTNTQKFCGNCGKSQPTCPNCGTVTDSKFCTECGEKIQGN